jgi:hypothetical protein
VGVAVDLDVAEDWDLLDGGGIVEKEMINTFR